MVKNLPTNSGGVVSILGLGRQTFSRRKWQRTPVFFPGESHAQRSLAGYSPGGHKELDMTWLLNNNIHMIKLFSEKIKDSSYLKGESQDDRLEKHGNNLKFLPGDQVLLDVRLVERK